MSAGAVRAGAAYVEIFANDSKFQQALTRVQNRLKSAAASMKSIGSSMSIGGAALGAPFVVAAREAATFTSAMAMVQANTNATAEQMDRLTKAARQMGVAMGRTPTETANAMSELAKAGLDAEGTISAIGPVLALAAADNMELARAVEVVVGTMSQFGMTTQDFGSIADRLQAAANASTTSVDAIGESLSYVGPQAQQAGQSFDDVAAALGTLAQGGIRGSMAGTQLARVIESMASEEGKFNALGVSVRDATGNLRPFMDVLRDLGGATAGMNNADKLQVFMDIFDIRGSRAASTLSQLGGEFERILGTIQGSAGAAASKAETVLQSFGGQVQILAAKFADLKVALITSMGQSATNVVAAFGRILDAVTQFIQRNPQLVAGVAAVAGGLLALGVSVTAGGFALGVMAKGLGVLKAALAIIPALCTPVGLAIVGIGAAVTTAAIVARELSPAFKRETDAIWMAITQLDFQSAWKLMNLNFAIALTEMAGQAQTILGQIQGFFAASGSFIGDKLVEGLDRFMGFFGKDIGTIQSGLERLGLYFKAAFDWDFAKNGLEKALKDVDDRIEKERKRSPTADSRAADRRDGRQKAADDRQAGLDGAKDGWKATADELRRERDSVRKGIEARAKATEEEKKTATESGQAAQRPDMGVMPVAPVNSSAVAGATQGFGTSLGTFGTSAEGIGIGPALSPMEDAAKQTAGNTAEANQHLASIDGKLGPAGSGAVPASAVGISPAVATIPARAADAQAGTAAAASGSSLGAAFESAITKVVEAVNAHAKISQAHTPLLNTIAKNTAAGGIAFS